MSAAVCGKRSLFEDLYSSPPIAKRLRFARGSSPTLFVSAQSIGARSGPPFEPRLEAGSPKHPSEGLLLSQLHALFPDMEEQVVEKVLESSNNDLDHAIKSLNLLRLSSSQGPSTSGPPVGQVGSLPYPSVSAVLGRPDEVFVQHHHADEASSRAQSEGGKWVEILVNEMMSASDMNDARTRAMHTLEAFENTVMSRSTSVIEDLQKENVSLKEQHRGLVHDNHILKRAVAIQHERQQEHEGRTRELQQLKQLLGQYQEQVRTLELSNYSLTLHLRQAQEGNGSMPSKFHPDVF